MTSVIPRRPSSSEPTSVIPSAAKNLPQVAHGGFTAKYNVDRLGLLEEYPTAPEASARDLWEILRYARDDKWAGRSSPARIISQATMTTLITFQATPLTKAAM